MSLKRAWRRAQRPQAAARSHVNRIVHGAGVLVGSMRPVVGMIVWCHCPTPESGTRWRFACCPRWQAPTRDGEPTRQVLRLRRVLARISHTRCGLRRFKKPTGQKPRAARCGASGKRGDTPCRLLQPALRVAFRRPSPASGGSTVWPDTLSPPDAVSAAPKEQRRPHGV